MHWQWRNRNNKNTQNAIISDSIILSLYRYLIMILLKNCCARVNRTFGRINVSACLFVSECVCSGDGVHIDDDDGAYTIAVPCTKCVVCVSLIVVCPLIGCCKAVSSSILWHSYSPASCILSWYRASSGAEAEGAGHMFYGYYYVINICILFRVSFPAACFVCVCVLF